jgi:hypothetical protein
VLRIVELLEMQTSDRLAPFELKAKVIQEIKAYSDGRNAEIACFEKIVEELKLNLAAENGNI